MKIPLYYKDAIVTLKQIQQKFPDAIFAGGCVRDLHFDKPIKDFDIFIEYSSAFTSGARWADLLNIPKIQIHHKSNSDFSHLNNHIKNVCSFNKNDILYDVIIVDTSPVDHVNRFFDIGLCKAYFNGKKFTFTSDFMFDKEHKTLTMLGEDMDINEIKWCQDHHLQRLKNKYSNFTPTVAPHIQKVIDKMSSDDDCNIGIKIC